jgi:hypothetical protein
MFAAPAPDGMNGFRAIVSARFGTVGGGWIAA